MKQHGSDQEGGRESGLSGCGDPLQRRYVPVSEGTHPISPSAPGPPLSASNLHGWTARLKGLKEPLGPLS